MKRGFTLLELLVALGLLSIVLMFVFNTFTYQHATYTVTDQVSEASQNQRAIARLLERDIRNAGYLVPPAAAACGVDSTGASDVLFLSDTDAILPADQLDVAFAGEELGGETSADPALTGATTVTVDSVVLDGNANYDTNADGTLDSDFRVGAGAILVDRGNPDRGVACGLVTNVGSTTTVTVDFMTVLGTTAPVAKDMVLVPANVYRIVPASTPPRLERNGVILAKDVEDLQTAWFYDDDDDSIIDSGEVRGASGSAWTPNAVNGNELREVRVNVVMRTRMDDPRTEVNFSIGQALENRATAVPAADGKHRRVHIANVRFRNLTL